MAKSRVFYGWWITGAAFFISLYVGGVVIYGFTAIFEPIANEMGWSYTQVSLAASLRGLEMAILDPPVGVLVDRWGPRRLIFIGSIILAGGLFLLSRTTSLIMFYGAFILISFGMSGCTTTPMLTAIAQWFKKRAGLATGIVMSGFGLGGLLVTVIVRLIETFEWRGTMVILALGTLGLVLPLSLLFRHKPEQYGCLPDGQTEAQAILEKNSAVQQIPEMNVKASQAMKGGNFWRITLAYTFYALVLQATITHVMPYLSSIGVARAMASLVATSIPVISIGGRLTSGWLGDRIGQKRVGTLGFALMGLGLLCFAAVPFFGTWLLVPFLIVFGAGFGTCNTLRPALVRDYFGRANFGTILGFIMGINMIGTMTGPPLAGWVYDTWGSYKGIWFILGSFPVISLMAVLTLTSARGPAKPIGKFQHQP